MKPRWIAIALLLAASTASAERYSLRDGGDFVPAGYRVEFADRYGWQSYDVDFEFGVDPAARSLTRDSRLVVRITKRDGRTWSYTCKAKGRQPMTANVNFVYGQGMSVVAQCAIPEKEFAKAVDLDAEDVGVPNLVFQAVVQDGQVRPGAWRGLFFLPGGQLESSDLNAYAKAGDDPSSLAVVFRSN